jgi:hypothetical protein
MLIPLYFLSLYIFFSTVFFLRPKFSDLLFDLLLMAIIIRRVTVKHISVCEKDLKSPKRAVFISKSQFSKVTPHFGGDPSFLGAFIF